MALVFTWMGPFSEAPVISVHDGDGVFMNTIYVMQIHQSYDLPRLFEERYVRHAVQTKGFCWFISISKSLAVVFPTQYGLYIKSKHLKGTVLSL